MWYLKNGRLVTASGVPVANPNRPLFAGNELQTLAFTLLDAAGAVIVPASDEEITLVGTVALNSTRPLFLSIGTVSAAGVITFVVDTYTATYLADIDRLGKPIYCEVGRRAAGAVRVTRAGVFDACADARAYIEGQAPGEVLYYYNMDQINAIWGTAPLLEFSVDGAAWHTTQTAADRYVRATPQGVPEEYRQPGPAIALVVGPSGIAGKSPGVPMEPTFEDAEIGGVPVVWLYDVSPSARTVRGAYGISQIVTRTRATDALATGNAVIDVLVNDVVVQTITVAATAELTELVIDFSTPVSGVIGFARKIADDGDTMPVDVPLEMVTVEVYG